MLSFAAQHGDIFAVELLKHRYADLNMQDEDGKTALLVAAEHEQLQVCEYLQGQGADMNLCDNDGLSPLYHLCRNGCLQLVEKFLERGANVNALGCLHIAFDNYYLEVAKILLANGCDVNQV